MSAPKNIQDAVSKDYELFKIIETDIVFYIGVKIDDFHLQNVISLYHNKNYPSEPVSINRIKVG